MTDPFPVARAVLAAIMRAILPLRPRFPGFFGTRAKPRLFPANSPIPWWIELKWPIGCKAWFRVDHITYFEDGYQVTEPIYAGGVPALEFQGVGEDKYMMIVGAPTSIWTYPRDARWLTEPQEGIWCHHYTSEVPYDH